MRKTTGLEANMGYHLMVLTYRLQDSAGSSWRTGNCPGQSFRMKRTEFAFHLGRSAPPARITIPARRIRMPTFKAVYPFQAAGICALS